MMDNITRVYYVVRLFVFWKRSCREPMFTSWYPKRKDPRAAFTATLYTSDLSFYRSIFRVWVVISWFLKFIYNPDFNHYKQYYPNISEFDLSAINEFRLNSSDISTFNYCSINE